MAASFFQALSLFLPPPRNGSSLQILPHLGSALEEEGASGTPGCQEGAETPPAQGQVSMGEGSSSKGSSQGPRIAQEASAGLEKTGSAHCTDDTTTSPDMRGGDSTWQWPLPPTHFLWKELSGPSPSSTSRGGGGGSCTLPVPIQEQIASWGGGLGASAPFEHPCPVCSQGRGCCGQPSQAQGGMCTTRGNCWQAWQGRRGQGAPAQLPTPTLRQPASV